MKKEAAQGGGEEVQRLETQLAEAVSRAEEAESAAEMARAQLDGDVSARCDEPSSNHSILDDVDLKPSVSVVAARTWP